MGIVHQVNLEHLAPSSTPAHSTASSPPSRTPLWAPTRTPHDQRIGVLGFGVGGIEAEAVMLGQPLSLPTPIIVGLKLTGALRPAPPRPTWFSRYRTAAQTGCRRQVRRGLRRGLSSLSLADRATIANMSPEFGATGTLFRSTPRPCAT